MTNKGGRPPKSTAELRLHGTYRKDRHGKRTDEILTTGAPQKPDDLDADGAWLWESVVSGLPTSVLGSIDTAILSGMCRWWSRWRAFDIALAQQVGDPYKTLIMAVAAWKQFESCASRFGMGPSWRASLKLPPDDGPQSKLSKYTG